MLVGDYVSTGPASRAEVQFDYGHTVRIGPDSQIRFAELGRNDDTVQLAAGTVAVGVLQRTSQFTQVETPSVTVRPREVGLYRITIRSDGTTAITVRSGSAAILTPQGNRTLEPGSTMLVSGPADDPSIQFEGTVAHDSFDQWNADRDEAYQRSNDYQYVSPSIPGAYALNGYGQWQSDPQYGYAWYPNVAAGWTPYSSGQWTSEPYYGWTWVDNDSWGYAPFHYGRWYHDQRRNRWAWAPGPRVQVQVWSPALVAFIGFGGAGVSIALGNTIGWIPLAPNERPNPWWGAGSRTYAVTNVTNIQNVYVNARYPNAVRAVPRQSFATGGYQHIAAVPPANFQHAVVMRNAVPVVPEPQSLRYTQRAPVAAHAPSAQVFHAFKTAPTPPQTFTQQRAQAATIAQHAAAAPPPRAQPAAQAPRAAAPAAKPVQPQQHQAAAPPMQHAQPAAQAPRAAAPAAKPVQPQQHQAAAPPMQHAQPAAQAPRAAAPAAKPVQPQQHQAAAPPMQHAQPAAQAPRAAAPVQQPQHQAAAPPIQHAQPAAQAHAQRTGAAAATSAATTTAAAASGRGSPGAACAAARSGAARGGPGCRATRQAPEAGAHLSPIS